MRRCRFMWLVMTVIAIVALALVVGQAEDAKS